MLAVASLGFAGSFEGCTCNADANLGNAQPKAPEPPPPPPPPAPVAVTPPPAPAVLPVAPKPIIAVGKAKIEGNKVKIPGELEFDVDKATLKDTPQSKEILTTLVDFMKQNPQVTKLRIEGHTDNSGKLDHNQTLSQQRADAVVDYLSKQGVDKTRLAPVGFGQTKPLVDNDTVDHKAQNRRTEFHVAEIDGKAQESTPPTPPSPGAAAVNTPLAQPAAAKKDDTKKDVKPAAVVAPTKK
jgi:OOP family OmpA-OmpF porin